MNFLYSKKKDEDDKGEMLSVSMDELPELVKDEEIRCAFTVHILNQATACIMFTECQTPFSTFTFYFLVQAVSPRQGRLEGIRS